LIKIFQKSLKKGIAELSNEILNSIWLYRIENSDIKSGGIMIEKTNKIYEKLS
tara:strand:- start:37429 stop:37587 length:159 start_codon:yes stop_codon:yes gene_type:complete